MPVSTIQKVKPAAPARAIVIRQLEILALRCIELADRVAAGRLSFINAVDLAYEVAISADLPNAIDASGLIATPAARAPPTAPTSCKRRSPPPSRVGGGSKMELRQYQRDVIAELEQTPVIAA
jgi:hypothetical protein